MQVISGDNSVLTVSPTTLTFTTTNYSTRQEVTYTAVDDDVLNHPPQHRRATVTFTASGGGFDGAAFVPVTIVVGDDEPIRFTVDEGRSYTLTHGHVVTQDCVPVVISFTSSDPSVLSLSPTSYTWTGIDSEAGIWRNHLSLCDLAVEFPPFDSRQKRF